MSMVYVGVPLEHEQQIRCLLTSATVEVAKSASLRLVVDHLAWPEEISQEHRVATLLLCHTPTPCITHTYILATGN